MTSMHEVRMGTTRGLRIATYNVHGVVGVDGKFTPERIAAVFAEVNADIFALQEVPLGGSAAPDVLAILQRMTGLHAVAGLTLDTPARRYGNAVRTRFPVHAGPHDRPVVQEPRAARRAGREHRLRR